MLHYLQPSSTHPYAFHNVSVWKHILNVTFIPGMKAWFMAAWQTSGRKEGGRSKHSNQISRKGHAPWRPIRGLSSNFPGKTKWHSRLCGGSCHTRFERHNIFIGFIVSIHFIKFSAPRRLKENVSKEKTNNNLTLEYAGVSRLRKHNTYVGTEVLNTVSRSTACFNKNFPAHGEVMHRGAKGNKSWHEVKPLGLLFFFLTQLEELLPLPVWDELRAPSSGRNRAYISHFPLSVLLR